MTTVRIEPLTRVEGHGRIDLVMRKGQVTAVQVALLESTRLFEPLVRGRSWQEVPALVCRICSICSTVHRIAAAQALERAFSVVIPPAAAQLRELLLLGERIESHALHLFALILPDIRGVAALSELLRSGDAAARQGLALRALGNRIQTVVGGRTIHPVTVEVGGMVRLPPAAELESLRQELAGCLPVAEELLAVFAQEASYPVATAPLGVRLAVEDATGFGLTGEFLRLDDGRCACDAYQQLLGEEIHAGTAAKQAAGAQGPFLTGALARCELFGRGVGALPASGIHANNAAQAREIVAALQCAQELLDGLLALPAAAPVRVAVTPGAGIGTAILEAPRGILVHHYGVDSWGRIAAADIVTPTAINQVVMEAQLLADLRGVRDADVLRQRAERIVRAYDPCISCAVHVLHG